MESIIQSTNDEISTVYPDTDYNKLEKIVSVTINGAVSAQLYDYIGDETTLYNAIRDTKCGAASQRCTVTNPSSRRRLGTSEIFVNEYQFEMVIEIEMDQYTYVDGTNLDDPSFITALESTLGITHDDAYTVSVETNVVLIGVTLKAENKNDQPLQESLIDDMEFIYNNITLYVEDLVDTLGIYSDYVKSTDLILCPVDRTCNGQGNDKCDTMTGICSCEYFNDNYWWGINCETLCECNHGAECIKGICHCEFPRWGLRCDNVRTECEQCLL